VVPKHSPLFWAALPVARATAASRQSITNTPRDRHSSKRFKTAGELVAGCVHVANAVLNVA
jgi:hypothetical protein